MMYAAFFAPVVQDVAPDTAAAQPPEMGPFQPVVQVDDCAHDMDDVYPNFITAPCAG